MFVNDGDQIVNKTYMTSNDEQKNGGGFALTQPPVTHNQPTDKASPIFSNLSLTLVM